MEMEESYIFFIFFIIFCLPMCFFIMGLAGLASDAGAAGAAAASGAAGAAGASCAIATPRLSIDAAQARMTDFLKDLIIHSLVSPAGRDPSRQQGTIVFRKRTATGLVADQRYRLRNPKPAAPAPKALPRWIASFGVYAYLAAHGRGGRPFVRQVGRPFVRHTGRPGVKVQHGS